MLSTLHVNWPRAGYMVGQIQTGGQGASDVVACNAVIYTFQTVFMMLELLLGSDL